MARVITVNDVLDGHVVLDIECLDRIYAYVPIMQTSSQVVAFLSGHLGFPFPCPALLRQMRDRFRRAVVSFVDANDIPWIKFGKEVMQPHLARQAGTGRSGVAAVGVAQEFQRVWAASEGKTALEPHHGHEDGAGGDHPHRHHREHLQEVPPDGRQVPVMTGLRRVMNANGAAARGRPGRWWWATAPPARPRCPGCPAGSSRRWARGRGVLLIEDGGHCRVERLDLNGGERCRPAARCLSAWS